jgi:hypothetical protein
MFDRRRPISHEQNGPAASGMLLHAFMHESVAYEVRFAPLDGQWLAILCVADTEHRRPLCPGPDELPTDLSPRAIRSGFIAVGEWLVKTGRWPDAESRSLLAEQALTKQAA